MLILLLQLLDKIMLVLTVSKCTLMLLFQGPPGPPGPPGLPTRELMGVPSDKHKVTTACFAKICKEIRTLQIPKLKHCANVLLHTVL